MVARSAGLLVHRPTADGGIEVLLVHPGGPFWRTRDEGAWSIPKGEHGPDDDPLATAEREFAEELGQAPPPARGDDVDLGEVRLRSGKRIWAMARALGASEVDVDAVVSNTFESEWPPRSGRTQTFPEVDRAGWFSPDAARAKLNPAQAAFVDRLLAALP
ncbi:MAG: NUDIX domain-containing protein [Acidimicrobiales bacterium]|nr:NUDIX domain-containing protein [Acidimicrobiales bacterium]